MSSLTHIFSPYYFSLLVCLLPFCKGDSNVRGFAMFRFLFKETHTQRAKCWASFLNLQLWKIFPISVSTLLKGFCLPVRCLEFAYTPISVSTYLFFLFFLTVIEGIPSIALKSTYIELVLSFIASFYLKSTKYFLSFLSRVIKSPKGFPVFTWSTQFWRPIDNIHIPFIPFIWVSKGKASEHCTAWCLQSEMGTCISTLWLSTLQITFIFQRKFSLGVCWMYTLMIILAPFWVSFSLS